MATLLSFDKFVGNFPIKSASVISDGDLVGIDSNGQVLLADQDVAGIVPAVGVAKVSDGSGVTTRTGVAGLTERCSIYRRARVGGLSSLTIGGNVWLSGTAGGYTQTAVATDTDLRQHVGIAISATEIDVDVTETGIFKFQTAATSTVAYQN